MQQQTQEWLEWRKKHVGASDQTHLHWSAPWSYGWGKLWDIKMGLEQEPIMNPHMERGIEREDEARIAYSLREGKEFNPELVESKEYAYLSASLDARSSDGQIAEIKCPGEADHASAVNGFVPKKYIPQLCHQLFVTGAPFVDYVSFDGTSIAVVRYKRNEAIIAEIVGAAHKFWGYVERGERPEGEWPHPEYDARIPVITEAGLIAEAKHNLELREKIMNWEQLLVSSDAELLKRCDLPRAKIGGLQITTRGGKRFVMKSR